MNKMQMKTGVALFMCLATLGSFFRGGQIVAMEEEFSEATMSGANEIEGCIEYYGTNADQHDYQNWAKPAQSYLIETDNGQWMRFQADAMDGGYLVEYYDTQGVLQKRLQIEKELPLFGALYATESDYYIFSGAENLAENSDAVCYRLTRYDREWNCTGRANVKDCNTTIPFYASGVSITHSGRYLIVRTGHQMYQGTDGLCHQANVTFQFDIRSMYMTDSFYGVLNSNFGYVSHSFNQFVRVDENRLIAIDHGDLYPRSIQLTKYTTDLSTGRFFSRCNTYDLVQLPMGIQEYTYTGASVGGFEVSDTAYLTAYNSVNQDEKFSENTTRNIYVAVLDKDTGKVRNVQITHIPEGKGSASTPYLVKLAENSFLLLWAQDSAVYYTRLNGEGEKIGHTYAMRNAKLSDCIPMVTATQVVWYVWNNQELTFYCIDSESLSCNDSVTVNNAHRWEILTYPQTAGGECVQICNECGETQTFSTASAVDVWWNDEGENGNYYPWLRKTEYNIGERLYMWIEYIDSQRPADELMVTVSDPQGCTFTMTRTDMGYLEFIRNGEYEITVSSKYNASVQNTFTVTVLNPYQLTGDVDGNGKVDQQDLLALRNYLVGIDTAVEWDSLDLNGDGRVNTRDVTVLLQLLQEE